MTPFSSPFHIIYINHCYNYKSMVNDYCHLLNPDFPQMTYLERGFALSLVLFILFVQQNVQVVHIHHRHV